MMKKFIVFTLALTFVFSLVAPAAYAQPEELTVWVSSGPELRWMRRAAEIYEEKTGISVEVEGVPELDQPERLALDGPAGHGPDVVGWPHDALGRTAGQGLVDPIENFIDINYAYDNFLEAPLGALTVDGELYGLPYGYDAVALIYNKDLISEIPDTFDELLDIAEELTDGDQYGFMYDPEFFRSFPFVGGFGGYIFGENPDGSLNPNDLGFAEPGTIEAAEYIKSFRDRGLLPQGTDGEIVGGLFQQGDLAVMLDGPWALSDALDAGINIGTASLPKLPNGEYPTGLISAKGYYVSNFSDHKQAAADFIKFVTNAEMSLDHYESNRLVVPHVAVTEALENDPILQSFLIQAERGTPMPNISEIMAIWEPANNGLGFVMDGRAPSAQVWPMVEQQIEEGIFQMTR
ncbi:extracellular solute-binding protein [Halonatronum saccharophilum]|uniref:extracellular solute-binding protein n=1 Tax=Halonatronum saccharophilum TaxID=150060 RepID=UPI00048440F6|nr:extracellular solute-binding protein [Halonatronum saccharophilum]